MNSAGGFVEKRAYLIKCRDRMCDEEGQMF